MAAAVQHAHKRPPVFGSGAALQYIALLLEDDPRIQSFALGKLLNVVDVAWAEASEQIARIETLAEDPQFPAQQLAAAVASKIYFHLETYSDALRWALSAGSYFDVTAKSEYVDVIVCECSARWAD
jgi:26S proteasome regulatory subunit N2